MAKKLTLSQKVGRLSSNDAKRILLAIASIMTAEEYDADTLDEIVEVLDRYDLFEG